MKTGIKLCLTLSCLLLLFFDLQAQELENVTVVDFQPPYEEIVIDYRGMEIPLAVTGDTKIKGANGKMNPEKMEAGILVENLKYEMRGGERVVDKLKTDFDPSGEVKFTGLLEATDGNVGIVDGRRVKLGKGVQIEGSGKKKKCQCKGMVYAGFADPLLQPGKYFLEVEGKETEEGYVVAEEVEACRNLVLEADRKLRDAVENSFTDHSEQAASLNEVIESAGAGMPLYKGQIQIGQYSYKLADDIELQGYVNMVGERVIPEHQRTLSEDDPNKIFFRFYVIDNEVPNAFAFPNGMIFIHTGLLDIIENEAQLATVLGHEIAHVTHEHGRDRYETTMITKLGKGLIDIGADFVNIKGLLGSTGLSAQAVGLIGDVSSAFTPEAIANVIKPQPKRESQADRVGVYYAHQAGYDVREGAKLWKNMSNLTGQSSFQSRVADSLTGMLESPQMSFSGNPLQTLGQAGKSMLMNELLNTIYTSHPKAKQRAHNIGRLTSIYYQDAELDSSMKGKEMYEEYTSGGM